MPLSLSLSQYLKMLYFWIQYVCLNVQFFCSRSRHCAAARSWWQWLWRFTAFICDLPFLWGRSSQKFRRNAQPPSSRQKSQPLTLLCPEDGVKNVLRLQGRKVNLSHSCVLKMESKSFSKTSVPLPEYTSLNPTRQTFSTLHSWDATVHE
jgi:hypothetical protein